MSSLEFWRLGLWHSSPFQGAVEGEKREGGKGDRIISVLFFDDKEEG